MTSRERGDETPPPLCPRSTVATAPPTWTPHAVNNLAKRPPPRAPRRPGPAPRPPGLPLSRPRPRSSGWEESRHLPSPSFKEKEGCGGKSGGSLGVAFPAHEALAHAIPRSLLRFSAASGHVAQPRNPARGFTARAPGPRSAWRTRGLSSGRPRARGGGGERALGSGKQRRGGGWGANTKIEIIWGGRPQGFRARSFPPIPAGSLRPPAPGRPLPVALAAGSAQRARGRPEGAGGAEGAPGHTRHGGHGPLAAAT